MTVEAFEANTRSERLAIEDAFPQGHMLRKSIRTTLRCCLETSPSFFSLPTFFKTLVRRSPPGLSFSQAWWTLPSLFGVFRDLVSPGEVLPTHYQTRPHSHRIESAALQCLKTRKCFQTQGTRVWSSNQALIDLYCIYSTLRLFNTKNGSSDHMWRRCRSSFSTR